MNNDNEVLGFMIIGHFNDTYNARKNSFGVWRTACFPSKSRSKSKSKSIYRLIQSDHDLKNFTGVFYYFQKREMTFF